ncbi:MAG: hypothetical protein JW747_05435 [Candidatus Aminicenantes bacterium]|nr:hypothetical protein [Candidatus Aminicenantes bacterium]
MKKALGIAAALVLLNSAAIAQFGYRADDRFSFSFYGGFGLSRAEGVSSYADTWDAYVHKNISEYADIAYQAEDGIAFGGAFTLLFDRNIGLEFGGALFGRTMPTEIVSGWEVFADSTRYADTYAFSGGGRLSSVPLFLNFVVRYPSGIMDLHLSAGPALFLNTAKADATGIYGDSYWYQVLWIIYEWIDFLPVAMEIPSTSWIGVGGNFGLGIDLNFSPMFAFFLEARAFLCGSKNLEWEYITGHYDGLRGIFSDWEFGQSQVDYLIENSLTSPLKINPSFFFVSAGIKLRFGL